MSKAFEYSLTHNGAAVPVEHNHQIAGAMDAAEKAAGRSPIQWERTSDTTWQSRIPAGLVITQWTVERPATWAPVRTA